MRLNLGILDRPSILQRFVLHLHRLERFVNIMKTNTYLQSVHFKCFLYIFRFDDMIAHIFTYWFAFPAFIPSSDTILYGATTSLSPYPVFWPIEISKMYKDLSSIENTNRMPVYGMKLEDNIWKITSLNEA